MGTRSRVDTSPVAQGCPRGLKLRVQYESHTLFLLRGARLLQPGTIRLSQELCPDDEMKRSEYYNYFMTPRRMRFGLNAVLASDGSSMGTLGLIRNLPSRPFTENDASFLKLLLPHLQRAIQLHLRITKLETENQAATEALN